MSRFYNLEQAPFNNRASARSIVAAITGQYNGAFFDAQDMSTMFQDAAGTTPVTAMEQPVGKWLDKSGKGNHATQSVTASRPVISARYNLLTKTEDFTDEAWSKQVAGTASAPVVTNNYGTAPDGTQTAARLILALNGGVTTTDRSCLLQGNSSLVSSICTSSVWVKSNTGQSYSVQQRAGLSTQIIVVDNTWRKYAFTSTSLSDNANWLALRGAQGTSDYADILIWHPQLEIGKTASNYQMVNTSTDYDIVGFKKYLKFDGVDDYLNLPYMGLYANGSASGVYAITNLQQTQNSALISERDTASIQSIYIPRWSQSSANILDTYIRNKAAIVLLDSTGVVDSIRDLRIESFVDTGINFNTFKNSVITGSSTYSRSGSLTLVNTTIGASVSTTTSNYANMNLYSLCIAKSALSDSERRRVERLLAYNSGAQI